MRVGCVQMGSTAKVPVYTDINYCDFGISTCLCFHFNSYSYDAKAAGLEMRLNSDFRPSRCPRNFRCVSRGREQTNNTLTYCVLSSSRWRE